MTSDPTWRLSGVFWTARLGVSVIDIYTSFVTISMIGVQILVKAIKVLPRMQLKIHKSDFVILTNTKIADFNFLLDVEQQLIFEYFIFNNAT